MTSIWGIKGSLWKKLEVRLSLFHSGVYNAISKPSNHFLLITHAEFNQTSPEIKQKRGVICGPDSANEASVSTCPKLSHLLFASLQRCLSVLCPVFSVQITSRIGWYRHVYWTTKTVSLSIEAS